MISQLKRTANYLLKLPLSYKLFTFLFIALLIASILPVRCPICGSIDINDALSSTDSLEIVAIEKELLDYSLNHAWCANTFISADYNISITVINTESAQLTVPILILGEMPRSILSVYASAIGNRAELFYKQLASYETAVINEIFTLWAVGILITEDVLNQAEFSVISDPIRIIASCPLCGGSQEVPLAEKLVSWVQ